MPDKPRMPTRSFRTSLKRAAMVRLEAGEASAPGLAARIRHLFDL